MFKEQKDEWVKRNAERRFSSKIELTQDEVRADAKFERLRK